MTEKRWDPDYLGGRWRALCANDGCEGFGVWLVYGKMICEECNGGPHVLYRHYDEDDELLYVGITYDPVKRLRGHKAKAHWYNEIRKTTYEYHYTLEALMLAEYDAIADEAPMWNKAKKVTHV